jgi:hypothetical protein
VSLAVFLLPHDGVVSHITNNTRDERVIALVHVNWVREAVPDAGHARCNRQADCLKTTRSSQALTDRLLKEYTQFASFNRQTDRLVKDYTQFASCNRQTDRLLKDYTQFASCNRQADRLLKDYAQFASFNRQTDRLVKDYTQLA